MDKVNLIAIVGRSATGKDYLLNAVIEKCPKLNNVIHWTTRPKRSPDENTYFFISEEDFLEKKKNQEFISVTTFRDWHYGITFDCFDYTKVNIGIFNPVELNYLYRIYGNKFNLIVIEVIADPIERYKRSINRLASNPLTLFDEEAVKEVCRRNKADEEDFKLIENLPKYQLNSDNKDNVAFICGVAYALGRLG